MEYRSIRVPEPLCDKAERWMNGRFESLEALVAFILQEIVDEKGARLDQQEEELVQQRLKDLGYI